MKVNPGLIAFWTTIALFVGYFVFLIVGSFWAGVWLAFSIIVYYSAKHKAMRNIQEQNNKCQDSDDKWKDNL